VDQRWAGPAEAALGQHMQSGMQPLDHDPAVHGAAAHDDQGAAALPRWRRRRGGGGSPWCGRGRQGRIWRKCGGARRLEAMQAHAQHPK
jgi:hypothetical protein